MVIAILSDSFFTDLVEAFFTSRGELAGNWKEIHMRRILMTALASAAFALSTTPAAAAEFLQCGVSAPSGSSCISDTSNVNLTTATGVGSAANPGIGTIVPSGPDLHIRSTESLNIDASGQATITAADGAINNITFNLLTGNITQAEFNLIDIANADFDVSISTLLNGVVTTTSSPFTATFNGSNRFGVVAGAGEIITGITINSAAGFGALTQLRLTAGSRSPIPEPGTWAMMLLGFGGIGMAMRRRTRKAGALMQVA